MTVKQGLKYTSTLEVTQDYTAIHLGSGTLNVFGTPAMIALMENAAMKAVAPCIDDTQTTVGIEIHAKHLMPTKLGDTVSSEAVLTGVDGRKLTFKIRVWDSVGIIGEANHTRFIVDKEVFMGKLK